MSAYFECKWCGKVFMPSDYDYDSERMNEDMREHTNTCKEREAKKP